MTKPISAQGVLDYGDAGCQICAIMRIALHHRRRSGRPISLAAYLFSGLLAATPVLAGSAALLRPVPAAAFTLSARDKADVARVEHYLDGIRSLTATFTQIAPDGSLATGKLFMRRPDRVRFEYNPPSTSLVVADGIWVVFHDSALKQTTRLPLGNSPLSILLADKVVLTDQVTVKSIRREPGALRISVYDTSKPKQGLLTLVFSDQPLVLRQWQITDAEGQTTTVSLDHVETNMPLAQGLFVYRDEAPKNPNMP